jgi:sugar lactone lactonase YvrE
MLKRTPLLPAVTLALVCAALTAAGSNPAAQADRRGGRGLRWLHDLPVGHIATVAGNPTLPSVNGPLSVALLGLCGVAVAPDGTVYLSDTSRHVVVRVTPDLRQLALLAGTGAAGFDGDGRPGRETSLHVPCQLAVDPANGEVLVADTHNYRIRAIKADGSSVRTVAGSGVKGFPDSRLPTEAPLGPGLAFGRFSGDGGPATEAELNLPAGIALDGAGNLYIGDAGNHRVRVVNRQPRPITVAGVTIAPGAIGTIAGTGQFGAGGDGGRALAAQLAYPKNIAVDRQGNILVVDSLNGRLRRIDGRTGAMDTVARSIPQTNPLNLIGVEGTAFGPGGEIYYSDLNGHAIFRVDPKHGGRELMVGIGTSGFTPDGGIASRSRISAPGGLAVGPDGALHFVEVSNNRARKIQDGRLVTLAGGGSPGEGVPATDAVFSVLAPFAVSPAGDLYIGDANLHAVRRISFATGMIETYAGTGRAGLSGVGGPPRKADLVEPALAFLPGDEGFHYLKDPAAGVILKVVQTPSGERLEAFAGSGKFGRGGDGGPVGAAEFSVPLGFAKHPLTGELYVGTVWMPTIRKIDRRGIITTVAGAGEEGYGGDGGPAMAAKFHWLTTLVFDRQANLYAADFFNNRIRVVTPDGQIRTFAGTGEKGFNGDGGPAADAQLNNPNDLVFDAAGNLIFTDVNNHRIRRIEARPPHRITTLAGTGERGFSGDGGPAIAARLNVPRALALSPDQQILYFTDSFNGRVRAIRLR